MQNTDSPFNKHVPGPYRNYYMARSRLVLEPERFFALAGANHRPRVPFEQTQIDCFVLEMRKRRGDSSYEFPPYVTKFVDQVLALRGDACRVIRPELFSGTETSTEQLLQPA